MLLVGALFVVGLAVFFFGRVLQWWRKKFRGYSLKGKVCLVTGAGRGLGREIAALLVQRAAQSGLQGLALWDIRKSDVEEVANELNALLGKDVELRIIAVGCDVSCPESVGRAIEETRRQLRQINVVINNAGIVTGRPFLQLTGEQMQRTMAVNSQGHWWLLKETLPQMIEANDGQVVTVASVMADMPACALSDYCSSKAAAAAFHNVLRLELRKAKATGVRTTLVCPYAITTGMFSGIHTALQQLVPHLKPQDVARAIVDAIANGEPLVYLPRFLGWAIPLLRLLPTELQDPLTEFAGGAHGMDSFQGRGLDFAMAKENK